MSSTSGLVLSTAMHRRIEHIAAELLICRSPASISNYIFSAVFTYFLGGFLRKKRWLLGLRPRPWWGSLQRSPTPPSWAGGVPPSRTLPGLAPPTTSPHPLSHPRRCPPPLPIPGSATDSGVESDVHLSREQVNTCPHSHILQVSWSFTQMSVHTCVHVNI